MIIDYLYVVVVTPLVRWLTLMACGIIGKQIEGYSLLVGEYPVD